MTTPLFFGVQNSILPHKKTIAFRFFKKIIFTILLLSFNQMIWAQDVDLELSMTSNNATPNLYETIRLTYTLTNTGTVVANNIQVRTGICNSSVNSIDGFNQNNQVVNSSPGPSASVGSYSIANRRWTIPQLAAGTSATLEISLFVLSTDEKTLLGEVRAVNEQDVDSTPGNLLTCTTSEDDEASFVINDDGVTPATPNIIVSNVNFDGSPTYRPGDDIAVTYDIAVEDADVPATITRVYLHYFAFGGAEQFVELGNLTTPAMSAGITQTFSPTLSIPTDAAVGEYRLFVKVDETELVAESSEFDNQASPPSVQGVSPRALINYPGLEITNVTCPSEYPQRGGGVTVNYQITLQNNSSQPTFATNLYHYQSEPDRNPFPLPVLGQAAVPALAAGEAVTISLSADLITEFPGYNSSGEVVYAELFFSLNPILTLTGEGYRLATQDVFCQKYNTDIELNLSADDLTYGLDDIIDYTITVTNNGSETAYNLFTDIDAFLPIGTLVNSSTSANSEVYRFYDQTGNPTFHFYIPVLGVGESATADITFEIFQLDTPDALTETVELTVYSGHLIDINESNNTDQLVFDFDDENNECSVTATIENVRCGETGNGTLITIADVTVNGTGNLSSDGYSIPLEGGGSTSGNYGETRQLNLGADYVQNALAGQFAITVIDQDDPTCRVDVSEPAPDCTIGETCTLTATIENIRCTSVLGNPLVTADVTVDATGNGSSSGYTLTVDGDNTNSQTFNYGQTTTISILNTLVQNVLNGNFAFNVTDLDNPSCTMDFSEPAINCAGNDDLIDLELSLSVDNPNPSLYQKIFPTYTLTNNSAQSATNVKVQVGMCSVQNGDFQNEFGFTNVNGFVYSSPSPSASFGSYNSTSQIWTLPEMAPGQTATLDLTLFTLTIEERKLLGQVTAANEMDTDSSPNNLMACDVQEDDEAAQSLNAAFGNCSGFIEITTQSGLNVFNGCTTWDGTIFINGDDIADLSPMNSLEIVTGDLHFRDNINLENLDGLENLRRVEGDNTRFNGLFIINNNQLQNIDGLSSLETINGGLNVGSNDALTDLDGLNSLTTVEDLKILNLESLSNLNGLSNLQSTNGLEIRELPLITNIDAFSNITTLFSISVADNNNLQNINGLSNLQQANLLSVADNSSLADCCGIFPILNNNGVSQQAFVQNNLSCNSVQDVLDNCGGANTCEITDAGVQWTCLLGGAGTEDDLVVLEVEPIGLNLGTSYTVNGPNVDNEVSGYGGLFTLHGFSTSIDAVYTYTITDNDNPDCTIEFTFNPSSASETCPAECSYNSNSTMATAFCDDNDTTDPSDDQWFISVNPTGTDLGSTFSVSSQSPVLNASNLAYGQEHIFGPFEPAQGNIPIYQVDLTITDDDFACSNSSILEIRGACSGGNNGVDLELGLSATNPNPNIFTKTTLTYTLTNTGTATAMNSSVRVGMCSVQNGGFVNGFGFINANGVVYSSPSPNVSTGSYNQSSQIWTVPQLAAGQSATLNVTVFLLTGEERVVLGEVQSMGQADVDSTPGNLSTCTTSEDDEARLALNGNTTELLPDLQLANLNSSATGEPGQIVNYTVDILNTGNTTASGDFEIGAYLSTDNQYQASDVLIGGIGTGNAPIGTQADIPGSVTVPVGANPGNYFLILLIDKDGEITESNENNNTISIPFTVEDGACICPDNYDPVCGSDGMTYGNACEAECAGIFSYTLGECPIGNDGVDLELELIAPANYNIYTTVTFQARVFNNGTVNAENAKVSFPLPDGFVHSSNSASQGSYDLFRERWNIGTIKAGETAVLDLNLFALTSDATTAYAQVSEANPTDVDSTPGNGTCCTPNEDDEAAVTISSSFQGGNGTTAHSLQKANRDVEIKTLYPNIATDEMTIFVQSKLPELNMRVYNLQGHEVLQKKYQDTEGFQRLQLNVSELPTGTYLIRFDGTLGQETVRFVKMRM